MCSSSVTESVARWVRILHLIPALAVDKVNGRGLSNTARHERLPNSTDASYGRITRQHQLVGAFQL